jgi:hypothetical protein
VRQKKMAAAANDDDHPYIKQFDIEQRNVEKVRKLLQEYKSIFQEVLYPLFEHMSQHLLISTAAAKKIRQKTQDLLLANGVSVASVATGGDAESEADDDDDDDDVGSVADGSSITSQSVSNAEDTEQDSTPARYNNDETNYTAIDLSILYNNVAVGNEFAKHLHKIERDDQRRERIDMLPIYALNVTVCRRASEAFAASTRQLWVLLRQNRFSAQRRHQIPESVCDQLAVVGCRACYMIIHIMNTFTSLTLNEVQTHTAQLDAYLAKIDADISLLATRVWEYDNDWRPLVSADENMLLGRFTAMSLQRHTRSNWGRKKKNDA